MLKKEEITYIEQMTKQIVNALKYENEEYIKIEDVLNILK